ncbi:hypothetical protein [Gemmatimonas sp.]|jgi:hypothetical protein|uniref:hypothetical protein n=1 Tax=Gemmatimonas sp. TaxID=1962908 RepID=UPI00333F1373
MLHFSDKSIAGCSPSSLDRGGGPATVLSTPGAFTVIAAGTRYRLRHMPGPSAEVVLVQPH